MAIDTRRPKNYRRAWNGGITAAEWNERHKPGIEVVVVLDDHTMWKTKTRSEAWELGHGQPVVMLEGKSGAYDLARVAPL